VKILGSRSKSTKTVDVKSVHLDKGLIFPSSVGKEFNWLHLDSEKEADIKKMQNSKV